MTNALILGSNISLSLLVGIVERHKEESISLICCTENQRWTLKRMGLIDTNIKFYYQSNLKDEILEKEIIFCKSQIEKWNIRVIFSCGNVNQNWLLGASLVKMPKTWHKQGGVDLEKLLTFSECKLKAVPDKKKLSSKEQIAVVNNNGMDIARLLQSPELKGVCLVSADVFPNALNFLSLGLTEKVFRLVLVICQVKAEFKLSSGQLDDQISTGQLKKSTGKTKNPKTNNYNVLHE